LAQSPTVGVLALQGAFAEHLDMLSRLGVVGSEVRLPRDLEGLDALILPGGESPTIGKLAVAYELVEPIRRLIEAGKPVWGTCAGMILLSRDVGSDQPLLGCMDVVVDRNAFGRQVDSFEIGITVPVLGEQPFQSVFIRAPRIRSAGPGVQILATLPDGKIVAARQNNMLVTAFHPELTNDDRWHRYFLSMLSPAGG
jgi:pyridoxal 5'-phosphate synthase pdxT subunit